MNRLKKRRKRSRISKPSSDEVVCEAKVKPSTPGAPAVVTLVSV